jgi:glutamate-ammonia-ligase adenylyltransferase
MTSLAARLAPCGPVVDAAAAERLREQLADAADAGGWRYLFDGAWPALEPAFAASRYLGGIARRWPDKLRSALDADPDARLDEIVAAVRRLAAEPSCSDAAKSRLRLLKADVHLLTALADLGGVWPLERVTEALTLFADASVEAALAVIAGAERDRGRLLPSEDAAAGPIPGLFGIGMGKYGAFELNYSSDIDVSLFYEPARLPLAPGVEPQAFVNRVAHAFAALLQERTAEGYVFRVDLRLRPDPSTTPPAVSVGAALVYYESVGQNWERAAFVKARPVGGDRAEAEAFLKALTPFVWRRSLDYAAIADVHSIKRQIHVWRADERLAAPGANLKLGAGGIREIEFFVQTQQLILGGRNPALRSPRTLEALDALRGAGHVTAEAAAELAASYRRLRDLEHRVQMLDDEQAHTLPEDDDRRRRVAALAGAGDLAGFDAEVEAVLKTVNRRYGELFADSEPLSAAEGSLVFTGVENDPATLDTLARMGFSDPAAVASTIRAWHHGRIPATRSARGRELFTRLAPQFLKAASAAGAPDAAFARFSAFFSGLSAGVQVQSLFLARPDLFDLLVRVLSYAPRLAQTLARRPEALFSFLDARFFRPLDEDSGVLGEMIAEAAAQPTFEASMDVVRRVHREQAFRIGLRILSGTADAEEAGRGFADLADGCVRALAPASLREAERLGGAFPGEVAVVGLGKLGSREMTARSDLDLMTIYRAEPDAASADKGWAAETFYARFTHRLVAALSAPTAEGELYEIDLQLRPSGAKGPPAVSIPAFDAYYAEEADTWEFLALTRARVVWATTDAFAESVGARLEAALRRPRDPAATLEDARVMRAYMEKERPPRGFWDLKLSPGGLVDCEFAAQALQLAQAPSGGPLRPGTLGALAAVDAPEERRRPLADSWRLHQNLSQLLKIALEDDADPDAEPAPFQALLAHAAAAPDFAALRERLGEARAAARAAFEATLG